MTSSERLSTLFLAFNSPRDWTGQRKRLVENSSIAISLRSSGAKRKPADNSELRQLRIADNSAPYGVLRDTKRTGRDSNSRYRVHRYAGFRDRCLQPLGHLSCSLATYRAREATSTRT